MFLLQHSIFFNLSILFLGKYFEVITLSNADVLKVDKVSFSW